MAELFVLGDLFEFFFEYRHAVPKGFVRTLGALARLTDAGVPVHYFVGNHDLWIRTYLTDEVGLTVYHAPRVVERFGVRALVGHGDGLSPTDGKYRALKRLFTNPFAQWLYRWLHPDLGIPLARWFSGWSRRAQQRRPDAPFHPATDGLVAFARQWAQNHPDVRFIVMGHRHTAATVEVGRACHYVNVGEWMNHFTFVRWNAEGMRPGRWVPDPGRIQWTAPPLPNRTAP